MSLASVNEVDRRDVPDWDERVSALPGGDVRQTTYWGEHWRLWGWRPRYFQFDDGFPVLALERRRPAGLLSSVYLPHGPIPAGELAPQTLHRLVAVSNVLAADGVASVSSDAAIPVATGYRNLLRQAGYLPIEEVEASRNTMRVDLRLAPTSGDLLRAMSHGVRENIRAAERARVCVVAYGTSGEAPVSSHGGLEWVSVSDPTSLREVLGCFYSMLAVTAIRRRFNLASAERVFDWQSRVTAAGLAVYLEARSPQDEVLGGALFYRAGGRFVYAHGSDRVDRRGAFPGVAHLLVWRAIQLALDSGATELDLGGIDVPGAREVPHPGDRMFGLYQFKHGFGASWIELAGHHERVVRPWRHHAARALGGAARLLRRARRFSDGRVT